MRMSDCISDVCSSDLPIFPYNRSIIAIHNRIHCDSSQFLVGRIIIMPALWDLPDVDDHEGIHFFRDPAAGLTAIIAVHSTMLGPAAGGVRLWHYSDKNEIGREAGGGSV